MIISKDENIVLHNILFEDYNNYNKWAPFFPEFVRENSKGVLAGELSPSFPELAFSSARAAWG